MKWTSNFHTSQGQSLLVLLIQDGPSQSYEVNHWDGETISIGLGEFGEKKKHLSILIIFFTKTFLFHGDLFLWVLLSAVHEIISYFLNSIESGAHWRLC